MKLSKVIDQFLRFRSSIGVCSRDNREYLKVFCGRVGNVDIADVAEDDVQKFLLGSGPLTKSYGPRHATLSGLFKFALARGYCDRLPLPRIRPKIRSEFTPYIYTRKDLEKLLETTKQTHGSNTFIEPDTLRIIITLLYGATLRISEALSLTMNDVDLQQGILTIRESKFYKTRLVPIGPKLKTLLSKYTQSRTKRAPTERFFLTKRKSQISRRLIESNFLRLRNAAGVCRDDGYFPRLHDLRHTGAVHRVIDWYKKGKDVNKLLPLLSTYMGHINLRCTQVYLTITPEIMRRASFKFEKYALAEVAS